ncbi:hypothetical protein Tco_0876645 [Tanacetum coccineum]|uniref:Uncharacterized protein n=1 Tax=Tanacetum coccineum TaxID=301880 RepID=A0ABQ5BY40_9ASTR
MAIMWFDSPRPSDHSFCIFNTAGLKWVPTGKTLTSSITKVDCELPNGLNDYITNPYKCDQTLNVSAGTLNLSAGGRSRCILDSVLGLLLRWPLSQTHGNSIADQNALDDASSGLLKRLRWNVLQRQKDVRRKLLQRYYTKEEASSVQRSERKEQSGHGEKQKANNKEWWHTPPNTPTNHPPQHKHPHTIPTKKKNHVTPGVSRLMIMDSEDDISWKSSDDNQDDEKAQDDEDEDKNDVNENTHDDQDDDVHDDDENAQDDDDEE